MTTEKTKCYYFVTFVENDEICAHRNMILTSSWEGDFSYLMESTIGPNSLSVP